MSVMNIARKNGLFASASKYFGGAIDRSLFREPLFLNRNKNLQCAISVLVDAIPDVLWLRIGQPSILQGISHKYKPTLALHREG